MCTYIIKNIIILRSKYYILNQRTVYHSAYLQVTLKLNLRNIYKKFIRIWKGLIHRSIYMYPQVCYIALSSHGIDHPHICVYMYAYPLESHACMLNQLNKLTAVRWRLGHVSNDATEQSMVGHVILISERACR